jgi:hypothetical protein
MYGSLGGSLDLLCAAVQRSLSPVGLRLPPYSRYYSADGNEPVLGYPLDDPTLNLNLDPAKNFDETE